MPTSDPDRPRIKYADSLVSLDDRRAVSPRREAILDPDHRACLNHEIFFFSDAKALARFRKHPLRSADSTLITFKALPDSFALRRGM